MGKDASTCPASIPSASLCFYLERPSWKASWESLREFSPFPKSATRNAATTSFAGDTWRPSSRCPLLPGGSTISQNNIPSRQIQGPASGAMRPPPSHRGLRGRAEAISSISLKSENEPEYCTIDCEGNDRAFFFENTYGDFSIEGFTIANDSSTEGSGIYCVDSRELIVTKCTFLNCSSPAIYLKDDGTMFTDCNFVGSGIKCVGWSVPWIFDSSFKNTHLALDLVNCTAYLKNVLLSDNVFAIQAQESSGVIISNCTIASNGHAIKHWDSPTVHYQIFNSIIWGNTYGLSLGDDIIVYSSYSDIQDGWSGIGNIEADPLFLTWIARITAYLRALPVSMPGMNKHIFMAGSKLPTMTLKAILVPREADTTWGLTKGPYA